MHPLQQVEAAAVVPPKGRIVSSINGRAEARAAEPPRQYTCLGAVHFLFFSSLLRPLSDGLSFSARREALGPVAAAEGAPLGGNPPSQHHEPVGGGETGASAPVVSRGHIHGLLLEMQVLEAPVEANVGVRPA